MLSVCVAVTLLSSIGGLNVANQVDVSLAAVTAQTDRGDLRLDRSFRGLSGPTVERPDRLSDVEYEVPPEGSVPAVAEVKGFTVTSELEVARFRPYIVLLIAYADGRAEAFNLATAVGRLPNGARRFTARDLEASRLRAAVERLTGARKAARVFVGIACLAGTEGAVALLPVEVHS